MSLSNIAKYVPSLRDWLHVIEPEPRVATPLLARDSASLAVAEMLLSSMARSQPLVLLFYERMPRAEESSVERPEQGDVSAQLDDRAARVIDGLGQSMSVVAVRPEGDFADAFEVPTLTVGDSDEAALHLLIRAAGVLVVACTSVTAWMQRLLQAIACNERQGLSVILVGEMAECETPTARALLHEIRGSIAALTGECNVVVGELPPQLVEQLATAAKNTRSVPEALREAVHSFAFDAPNKALDAALQSGRYAYAAEIAHAAAAICRRNNLSERELAFLQRVAVCRFVGKEFGSAMAAIDDAVGLSEMLGRKLATATVLYIAAKFSRAAGLEPQGQTLANAAADQYRAGSRADLADGLLASWAQEAGPVPIEREAHPPLDERPSSTPLERLILGESCSVVDVSCERPPDLNPADMRNWTCVMCVHTADEVMEQWCPRGTLPSRARVLLSRTRWNRPLAASPRHFVESTAVIAAQGSLVRPAFGILFADDKRSVGLSVFEQDLLMGDNWRLQVVAAGSDAGASVALTVEVQGAAPQHLDAWVVLTTRLATAPTGALEVVGGPTVAELQRREAGLPFTISQDRMELELQDLAGLIYAAESIAPSLEANTYLMRLATRLAGIPGAAFFGLAEDSLRLFRVALRRTPGGTQSMNWAFGVRGALSALALITSRDGMPKLVDTCSAALERVDARGVACAILYHLQGELLLAVGSDEYYQRALVASTRSCQAAEGLENGEPFLLLALESLARVYRALGMRNEEIATLTKASSLPGAEQLQIEQRLHELSRAQTPGSMQEGWTEHWQKHVAATKAQVNSRVVHASPFRRASGLGNILVLRPLVTSLDANVPNGFVNYLRHNWRFQDEPATMTFEETLSRALGHHFSFTAVGAQYEAYGVGRFETLPQEGADPEGWKAEVEIMVGDPILSTVLLVYPSDSPGMQWELDLLARTWRPNATYLIPPHVDSEAGRQAWTRASDALRKRGIEIPEWHPNGIVFQHDARGAITTNETFEVIWDGRLATRLQSGVVEAVDAR